MPVPGDEGPDSSSGDSSSGNNGGGDGNSSSDEGGGRVGGRDSPPSSDESGDRDSGGGLASAGSHVSSSHNRSNHAHVHKSTHAIPTIRVGFPKPLVSLAPVLVVRQILDLYVVLQERTISKLRRFNALCHQL